MTQIPAVDTFLRTLGMAAAVTLADGLLAFPLAYYMARYAGPRMRALLLLTMLMPLLVGYLVRAYAWKLVLVPNGATSLLFGQFGGNTSVARAGEFPVSTVLVGMFVVYVCAWLPYMIIPINAALERVPAALFDASGDLGARALTTFRHVTLPFAWPGIVAGSIFTFLLTLGDVIVPMTLGKEESFISQAVLAQQGFAVRDALAAAFRSFLWL